MEKRVISVDDDNDIREAIRFYLKKMKFDVTAFSNGTEMLAYMRTIPRKPDLMILDYCLPDVTGSEVARCVRDQFQGHEIPIIFVSAEKNLPEIASEFEGAQYLPKPIKFQDLRELLQISFCKPSKRIP